MTSRVRAACLAAGLVAASAIGSSPRLTVADDGAPPQGPVPVPAPAPAARQRPDVLLVSVDALRADHLGFMGSERATSPHIDALAAKAVVFDDAWSASSWTPPSATSFLTGLHPIRHGNVGGPVRLTEDVETLAETLKAAGWRTRATVQNAWFSKEFGLSQGFDRYDAWKFIGDPVADPKVEEDLASWMRADAETPFLLWVHHFSPHCPYVPHEPWISSWSPPKYSKWAVTVESEEMRAFEYRMILPQDLERFTALYDSEIAFTDEHVGKLLASVPHPERTIVVFVADHGEEFKDHGGMWHYRHLHREVARVPFFIALPGQTAAVRHAGPVSATDLVPTLRALLGMPAAAGLDGMPLLGASGDRPGAVQSSLGAFDVGRASDMVFSFKYAQSYNADMSQAAIVRGDGDGDGCDAGDGPIGNSFAVRDRRWSLLCDTSERDMESSKALDEAPAAKGRPRFTAYGKKYRYRLYDRIADPGETTDVTARFPAEARRLALALRAEFRRAPLRLPPERPTMKISPEIEDELRGLGYVK